MDVGGFGVDSRSHLFLGRNRQQVPPCAVSKAMANTHADILDYPNAYKFVVDMPGLKSDQVKVDVEDNKLVVCGERKRDKDKDQKDVVKYIRTERRLDKFLKKF